MILLNPYVYANRNGILRLEANSVNVGTTNVTFTFTPHNFLNKAGIYLAYYENNTLQLLY